MVDITVASVIAVASAVVFWAANFLPFEGLQVILPGLGGLVNGFWLFAGPLAAVIVRKPGAAIYAETLAAVIESLLGNAWGGVKTIVEGLLQGAGAEIAFLIFGYVVWTIWTTMLAGTLAGVMCWTISFATHLQAMDVNGTYSVMYLISTAISGAIVAGLLAWWLYCAIAKTGVLDRFASGRKMAARQAGNR